mmetsp:Transcript_58843/g.164337  ORF Transcript_58843/g.164337 Transcript_58843/m.164337 type:complete len:170 (-) Transcript_58843:233-742(-)
MQSGGAGSCPGAVAVAAAPPETFRLRQDALCRRWDRDIARKALRDRELDPVRMCLDPAALVGATAGRVIVPTTADVGSVCHEAAAVGRSLRGGDAKAVGWRRQLAQHLLPAVSVEASRLLGLGGRRLGANGHPDFIADLATTRGPSPTRLGGRHCAMLATRAVEKPAMV